MEFRCSVCQYTSFIKGNITKHIQKTSPCGEGVREVVTVFVDIKCDNCNKSFMTKKNLKYHVDNNVCGVRNTTSVVAAAVNAAVSAVSADFAKQIEQLKEEVKKTKPIVNNYNIVVHNYYNTDLSVLKDEDYINLIEEAENYQLIPRFVKLLHFSIKFPQNHNICISNCTRNNKHVKLINDGVWQLTDKETQINNLIAEKEDNINEWVTGPGSKYPDTAEKFNDYLELKTEEDIKIIKQDIELVLYNGSKIINQ